MVHDLWFMVHGLWFRVSGSGFRVWSLEFRGKAHHTVRSTLPTMVYG